MFATFKETLKRGENALLLIFTDGRTNMSGLDKGVKTAVRQKHRVIVVILSRSEPTCSSESMSRLKGIGVCVTKCQPRDIWNAVKSGIVGQRRLRRV